MLTMIVRWHSTFTSASRYFEALIRDTWMPHSQIIVGLRILVIDSNRYQSIMTILQECLKIDMYCLKSKQTGNNPLILIFEFHDLALEGLSTIEEFFILLLISQFIRNH